MPTLQIRLFGDFQLLYNGELMTTINQARLQSLLAYLVLHRNAPQSRQHLAFLFWPDTPEAQAHTNLRQLLHHLRRSWPAVGEFLHIDAKTLQWKPGAACAFDIVAFEQAAVHAAQEDVARAGLEEAVALYGGDLLPGCYEEWLLTERERLRQHFLDALEQLMVLCERERDYPAAIHHAQRLLRADPLHETTYRRLMRLHALTGDRASALRTYHTCATVLERELGVEPNPDTQEDYARLLKLEVPPVLDTATAVRSAGGRRLVGRQAEWKTLQAAWQKVLRGCAQFVCIRGEAGIGKTRLAEEMFYWTRHQGIAQARTRTYAAEGSLAYAPVTEWLRAEVFQPARKQLPDLWLSEVARLLPEILIEHPTLPRPEPLTERWQRQRFFEAIARTILAGGQPLLLLIDDLQWCDPETLEWLAYLLRFDARARLLIIGTVRPEELATDHPLLPLLLHLRTAEQLTELDLTPLSESDTVTLACQVTTQTLDAGLLAKLYQETEGNPLFVIETVRASLSQQPVAFEDQAAAVSVALLSALPPKIHAVIHARLAQLSPAARALAQLAATIGRAFTVEVVAEASGVAEEELVRSLDELWRRRIVREQGANTYDFSHDRIRDVAYTEIGPIYRRQLHRRVAQGLEQIYAASLDTVNGQIAAHYELAGLLPQALPYYQQAAEVALRVYANAEAVHYLTKGLALLQRLPATRESIQQELSLQLDLGLSLTALQGIFAPEVRAAYERAYNLAVQLGDDLQRCVALAGQFGSYLTQGRLQKAHELAKEYHSLVQRLADAPPWLVTRELLGTVLFYLGQFSASQAYLGQVLARSDFQPYHLRLPPSYSGLHQPRIASTVLWHLGYFDQALALMDETLARAQELAHPYDLAAALVWSAWLHQLRREPQRVQARAEAAIALSQQQGFPHWLTFGTILLGWATAHQGQYEEGISQMRQGLATRQSMTAQLRQPTFLGLLAEVYGKAGQPEQGLRVLDETLATIAVTGEHFSEAELHRLKGELLWIQGASQQAVEVCFRYALDLARSQEAKSLELRAAMSLSRLWQQQGKQAQARDLLAGIYNWFTEGFDITDLQESRALLEELQQ